MIKPIHEEMKTIGRIGSILDIGCGTCNLKKWLTEFRKEDKKNSHYSLDHFDYYVIEKSKILIDRLDKDTIVLGTDFNETTLN